MRDERFYPERFIDREVEQELFFKVLLRFEDARLLTIRDVGGRGKSSLLKQLRYKCGWQDPPTLASLVPLDQLPEPTPFALIVDIKNKLAEHADSFGAELHFDKFDNLDGARTSKDYAPFRTRVSQIGGGSGGTTGAMPTREYSEYSRADADDSPESWNDTKENTARKECIKVFFEELREVCATQRVVVLLDSWERSNLVLQEWIVNRIMKPLCLDTVGRPEKFGLVLAGRELPDFRQVLGSEKYNKLVESIESLGQWDEEHVKAFLQAYNYEDISAEDDLVRFIHSKLRSGLSLEGALQWAEAVRDITIQVG